MGLRNAVARCRPSLGFVTGVQALALVLAILSHAYRLPSADQAEALVNPLCAAFTSLCLWCFASWYALTRRLFDPYTLFLLSLCLFNGGQAILRTFHLDQGDILGGMFSPATVSETLYLVILAVGAVHLGALVALGHSRGTCAPTSEKQGLPATDSSDCRFVGWCLLAVSIVPLAIGLHRNLSTVRVAGYFGLFQGTKATGFRAAGRVLSEFFSPAVLFLLAGSVRHWLGRLVCTVCVILHWCLWMLLGGRHIGASLMLAFLWLWDYCIRPIPKGVILLVGGLALFVVFPAVAEVRDLAGPGAVSRLIDAILSADHPVVATISEMGASMRTISHTLELVPGTRGHDLGVGYLCALTTVFPNLFWDLHPAVRRGSAADWLVRSVDPTFAAAGGGLGFSVIAEAYLNFGKMGVPLVMGLLGYALSRLVVRAYASCRPSFGALVACCLADLLYLARGEMVNVVRGLTWYALAPYLLVGLVRTVANRRACLLPVRERRHRNT